MLHLAWGRRGLPEQKGLGVGRVRKGFPGGRAKCKVRKTRSFITRIQGTRGGFVPCTHLLT